MVNLFPSQQEILDEVKDKNRVAFYLGVGAGKTFIGSEKLIQFNTPFNLVVCQKSQVGYWVNHFQTHYPEVSVTDLTKFTSLALKDLKPGVMVINYEVIFRRPTLLSLKNYTLMLDESSLIQHTTTKRTKFILKMKPTNVILLSGTPVSGGKLDKDEGLIFGEFENLISQCKLLGWNVTKKGFQDRYCNCELRQYGEVRFNDVVSYKNIKELNSKLRSLGCVFRRTEDIVELPDENDQTYYVDKTTEYKKMNKHGIVEVDGVEFIGDYPVTKFLRLRQLCGAYNKDKVTMLSDLLETLGSERVIVFYNFQEDLKAIKKVVGDRPFSQINGEVKDTNAYETYDNAVIACQYQSGSRGHNLQQGGYIIYFTPTVSAEMFDQSRGRIRRAGQKREVVNYYHLIVKGSIEEKILANVSAGLDYTVDDYIEEYEN